jgi:hypothetical protein
MASVGYKLVTRQEFLEAIDRLHKSGKVGKALAETKDKSFVFQDYGKFLDELVDEKLMVIEAEALGYDKDPGFMSYVETNRMNLALELLRKEEVLDKAIVEEAEILEHYETEMKKKAVPPEVEQGVEGADGAPGGEAGKPAEERPREMSAHEREAAAKAVRARKVKAREEEYFAALRGAATVEKDAEALKAASTEDKGSLSKPAARVDGAPIAAGEVLYYLRSSKMADTETARLDALDMLILHRLLDREALRKGYTEEKEIRRKAEAYGERILINLFKKKAVEPLVTVDEGEVLEYYNANSGAYKSADMALLSVIAVEERHEAEDILGELKGGADFAYLAREKSLEAPDRGGDIGWVRVNDMFPELRDAVMTAGEGDYLGPYEVPGQKHAVYMVRGYRKGEPLPLDVVRADITKTVRARKYEAAMAMYLERLRDAYPIKINRKEMRAFEAR